MVRFSLQSLFFKLKKSVDFKINASGCVRMSTPGSMVRFPFQSLFFTNKKFVLIEKLMRPAASGCQPRVPWFDSRFSHFFLKNKKIRIDLKINAYGCVRMSTSGSMVRFLFQLLFQF
jgi:hypothetical protein